MRIIIIIGVMSCLSFAACTEEDDQRKPRPGQRFELVESTIVETSCPEGAPFYFKGVYNLDLHNPIGKAPNKVILSAADESPLWGPRIVPALSPHTWQPLGQADGWPPYDWPSEDWADVNDARNEENKITGAKMRDSFVLTQDDTTVSMDYVWDLFDCDHWSKCVPWGEDTCRLTMRYDFEYTVDLADDFISNPPTE